VDWVKLAVDYFDDDRIEALDDAAEVMFTRGIARAGKVAREGFIPESSLAKLTRRRRYEPLVDELVQSGLWTRVPGGVRVTNWDHWQDALDELARRRTKDRDRQRNRRQRLREEQESTVSRDNAETSRDMSRDVTHPEGERDLERDFLGGNGYVPARASEPPPPLRHRCKRHAYLTDDDPGPPCVACRDARLAAQATPEDHAKPVWCGDCNERTRQIELDDGRPARCPVCHPLRSAS
jgi:hypothetical protein